MQAKLVDFHTHASDAIGGKHRWDMDPPPPERHGLTCLHERSGYRMPLARLWKPLFSPFLAIEVRRRVRNATPHGLRRSMDRSGVTHACVLPIEPIDDTEEFVRRVRSVPGLVPFGSVNPRDPRRVEKVHRYLELGIRGLKLHPILQRTPPSDSAYMEVVEAFAPSGLPVLFHTGVFRYTVRGAESPQNGRMELYEPIVESFPHAKFVFGHMGLLTPEPAIALAERYPNVWLEASFQPFQTVVQAVERVGEDRVLLGSDWPATHQRGIARIARALDGWDSRVARNLSYKNAESLIGPLS